MTLAEPGKLLSGLWAEIQDHLFRVGQLFGSEQRMGLEIG
jgi:hypothetical protein